jgi:hypothetical protein
MCLRHTRFNTRAFISLLKKCTEKEMPNYKNEFRLIQPQTLQFAKKESPYVSNPATFSIWLHNQP